MKYDERIAAHNAQIRWREARLRNVKITFVVYLVASVFYAGGYLYLWYWWDAVPFHCSLAAGASLHLTHYALNRRQERREATLEALWRLGGFNDAVQL